MHSWMTRLSTLSQPDPPAPIMLERLLSSELTIGERLPLAIARYVQTNGTPVWPTLSAAIEGLGLDTFRGIALPVVFHCIAEDLERRSGLSAKKLVQEAVAVGTIARALTRRVSPASSSESFSCGFVVNIGVPFMAAMNPVPYRHVSDQLNGGAMQLHEAEFAAFGYDHTTLGSVLLADYDFSKTISAACGSHHEPTRSADMASAVSLAETLAHQLGFSGAFAIAPPQFDFALLEAFRTTEADLGDLADETNRAVSSVTMLIEH